MKDAPLLNVKNLSVVLHTRAGEIKLVDDLCLNISRGQTVGLVGESGCGKSVTALSIMGLLDTKKQHVEGTVLFNGQNLLHVDDAEMRKLRGNKIAIIFQDPMTSLNPVFCVGTQIAEVFQIHKGMTFKDSLILAERLLSLVGIADTKERIHAYPHELSGGMLQRIMIAMAIALKPDLLIADEPTTALDVTIQSQILSLLKTLQKEMGMGLLLITHDLGVVAETCDDVYVMYAGCIVERAPADILFASASHPYTLGLLGSVPGANSARRLKNIPGLVPNLTRLPSGCRFQDRCDRVLDQCRTLEPPLREVAPNHWIRCINPKPTNEKVTSC